MSDLRAALLRSVIDTAEPGAGDLCRALERAVLSAGAAAGPVDIVRLKSRVWRLRIGSDGQTCSLVLKRFDPWLARRNELVARRWLPAMGLGERCARLLATAADHTGQSVWHVYEDLGKGGGGGGGALDAAHPDRADVAAVVDLIAELHTRAAGHPLLPECRHYCGDLGAPFFAANVRDALTVLSGVVPPRVAVTPAEGALRERLLARLRSLCDEVPERVRDLQRLGGPDTLLHGDLWTSNTFVQAAGQARTARFIDWDHAAVGPATYDLSTFLYRFPAPERPRILERYQRAVAPAGWRLPSAPALNALFATAEYGRYANRVIWPAVALLQEGAKWGWEQLAEVERWFIALQPALLD